MRRCGTVIIGGGISGATLLHRLARSGEEVLLLERQDRLGGVVWSHRTADGVLVETGANSSTLNREVAELISDLGLDSVMIRPAPEAASRFVMREGRLLAVPSGPKSFFQTELFTGAAKLRLLRERFVSPRVDDGLEESVADFVARRLGNEFLAYAIDPFVSGVYSGDPRHLSMQHAFPKVWHLEQEHRSLIRGAFRLRRERKRARRKGTPDEPRGMFSFEEGMGMLPRAIHDQWRDRVVTGSAVESLERIRKGWRINCGEETFEAQRLVMAVDAPTASALLSAVDSDLAAALRSIEYPPVTVAASIYRRSDIAHRLDGFGMLIPSSERRQILGTVFSSSLFPNRAPEGLVLLTSFIGGSRDPAMASRSFEDLDYIVHAELRRALGISARPVNFDLHRWTQGIPQYNLGYGTILNAIEQGEGSNPGLYLLGNYRGGIALGDCVKSAYATADVLLEAVRLGRSRDTEQLVINNY